MTLFNVPVPSWVADVVAVGASVVTGEWSAFVVGVVAGFAAVAFTLGGFWAMRGRPTLVAPYCRRCSSTVRGGGRSIPDVCPECGNGLSGRGEVRWLRFRRQPFTVAVTAPVVLLGGGLLAILASFSAMSAASETWRRWRVSRAIETTQSEGPNDSSAVQVTVRHDPLNIGRVPGLGSPNWIPPTMSVRIDAYRQDPDLGVGMLRDIVAALATDHPAAPVTAADVERLRALARELLLGGPPNAPLSGRRQSEPNTFAHGIELTEALLAVGYVDETWAKETVAHVNDSVRLVVAPAVRPGGVVGVRAVDAYGRRIAECSVLSATRGNEEILLPLPPNASAYRPPFGGFLAPNGVGTDDVTVTWLRPLLVWAPSNDPRELGRLLATSSERSDRVRYEVVEGDERLPASAGSRVEPPISTLQLAIRECGVRDVAVLTVGNFTPVQMRGRWSLHVVESWEDVTPNPYGVAYGRQGTLIRGPDGPWPDSVRVRFEPIDGVSDRLATIPAAVAENATMRFLLAMNRAVDSAWTAPCEFTLVLDDERPVAKRFLYRLAPR